MYRALAALALLALIACAAAPKPTAADVIAAFKSAGLAADSRPLTREDYGAAPLVCEAGAQRLRIAALGEDSGGRVFACPSEADAAKLKAYYDALGTSSALLASWTYQRGPLLVQLAGDLDEATAKQYEAALATVK